MKKIQTKNIIHFDLYCFFSLVSAEAFTKFSLEKDVAVEIVKLVSSSPLFTKIGEGEWQCIVGRNFGCSLTFDAHVLSMFDLISAGKTILLFKSG